MRTPAIPIILAFILGCEPDKTVTPEEEARRFLATLYPQQQFHIVCDKHTFVDRMHPCSAARVGHPELPPIAMFCHAMDIKFETCHLPGEEQ